MLWSRSSSRQTEESAELAGIVSALAVFLRAGLSPRTSWSEVSLEYPESPEAASIAHGMARGGRHSETLQRCSLEATRGWRYLSAVVGLADQVGAPLAETLENLAESLRSDSQSQRHVMAIAEAPKLTVVVLLALPGLGLVIAQLLGVSALPFLLFTGLGRVLLLIALAMMILAVWWMRAMVRAAFPAENDQPLSCELLAIATRGGGLPEQALERVRETMALHDLTVEVCDQLTQLVALSRRAGVPIATLASVKAKSSRKQRLVEALQSSHRLSVVILVPLGLLVLPAFVIVAVIPVVITLLSGVIGVAPVPW